MGTLQGNDAVITIDSKDISSYGTSVTFSRSVDSHDVTTFGNDAHKYATGLTDGTVSLSGLTDAYSVTGGPGPVFDGLMASGLPVVFVYKAEGTGAGKPVRTVTVVVTSYEEEAAPDDRISWSAELQFSGTVAVTTS